MFIPTVSDDGEEQQQQDNELGSHFLYFVLSSFCDDKLRNVKWAFADFIHFCYKHEHAPNYVKKLNKKLSFLVIVNIS